MVAMLQGIMQTAGFIIGGLVLFKLTNSGFSTPPLIFKIISLLILVPNMLIHLKYKERCLESEKKIK